MTSPSSIRFPLYAKTLLWFFLNLLILGLAFYIFLTMHMNLGLDTLLMGRVGDRLKAVAEVIALELRDSEEAQWTSVLNRFSTAYQVTFRLFSHDGTQTAGPLIELPRGVMERLRERSSGPGLGMGGPPPGRGRNAWVGGLEFPPETRFLLKTQNPTRYWTGMDIVSPRQTFGPRKMTLLIESNAIHGNGLFLDLSHLGMVALTAVLLSAMIWLPFVRTLTQSIKHLTRITESIADGKFNARANASRNDEIGRLSVAINQMAERLDGYITGQKRFLSDTAHELCSPLARMELGLSIIEQQTTPEDQARLKDVRDEVSIMTDLVNDLLAFSRNTLRKEAAKRIRIKLAPLIEKVIHQEAPNESNIQTELEETIEVIADPNLLERSIANVLRNAVRYAGKQGPICILATSQNDTIELNISDKGPGVPAESLEHLFDPFYRPAPARDRASGGTGLGLAIVKTGIEACAGTVSCANLKPHGFEVRIKLPKG